jgi:hypothetical protein
VKNEFIYLNSGPMVEDFSSNMEIKGNEKFKPSHLYKLKG